MNIIVPMAGMGKRLRPHTLNTPKPLFPIAGKPIVQRLCEDLAKMYSGESGGTIDSIAFIIGDFGPAVEQQLRDIGTALGTKVTLHKQDQPLGTAHAIYCAQEQMEGEIIVAFADTLFRADFQLDRTADGVIWVNQVDNPKQFGVVTLDGSGYITGMVEKPEDFVSDLAIIGIYYFKDGPRLRREIKHLLDNDIKTKGEYQLTDAMERMRLDGARLKTGTVQLWMDCGNKEAVLDTNQKVLTYLPEAERGKRQSWTNTIVIEPCFIAEGVILEDAVVGPYVSIGKNSVVRRAVLRNTILANQAAIEHAVLQDTVVGNDASVRHQALSLNLGDYSAG